MTTSLSKNIGKVGQSGYKSFGRKSKESGGNYKKTRGERENDKYFAQRFRSLLNLVRIF